MFHQQHRCFQVDRVHEVLVLIFNLEQGLELAGDTGAVDKKVDPAELLKNTRAAIRDPARNGQIDYNGRRFAA
jgi:hypothetical protein